MSQTNYWTKKYRQYKMLLNFRNRSKKNKYLKIRLINNKSKIIMTFEYDRFFDQKFKRELPQKIYKEIKDF